MTALKALWGIALVVAGALLLIVAFVAGWTSSNWVLLGGLLLIIVGIILHIRTIKKTEKY